MGGIAIMTSPDSRVVHPGISLGIGLSNRLGLGISRPFAVVTIGETIVSIGMSVSVGGVMAGSIAIVTSPDSRVVQPGVSLRVSLGISLSNGFSLSLLHSDGRFLLNSSGGGGHNSGGYKTAIGAGDKSSSIVGASSS